MSSVSQIRLHDVLPSFYRGFLPEFFACTIPSERHVNCESCVMCRGETEGGGFNQTFFSAGTKCCTYHPDLPNYLVGALLESADPDLEEGRCRVQNKIKSKLGVNPQGILAPGRYQLLYRYSALSFGRSRSMICPLFDKESGRCTIWRFRESVAITYHCKHNYGSDGLRFWLTLRDYLSFIEQILVDYSLQQLGWPSEEILKQSAEEGALTPHELDEIAPESHLYSALWHEWVGREEDLYRQAFNLVAGLDKDTFEHLGGIRQTLMLDRLETMYRRMLYPELPETLMRNHAMEVEKIGRGYVLMSYSRTDPVHLRKEVYELLDFFDGKRSNAQALQQIRETKNKTLSQGLLTRLYQHRVLIKIPEG